MVEYTKAEVINKSYDAFVDFNFVLGNYESFGASDGVSIVNVTSAENNVKWEYAMNEFDIEDSGSLDYLVYSLSDGALLVVNPDAHMERQMGILQYEYDETLPNSRNDGCVDTALIDNQILRIEYGCRVLDGKIVKSILAVKNITFNPLGE